MNVIEKINALKSKFADHAELMANVYACFIGSKLVTGEEGAKIFFNGTGFNDGTVIQETIVKKDLQVSKLVTTPKLVSIETKVCLTVMKFTYEPYDIEPAYTFQIDMTEHNKINVF